MYNYTVLAILEPFGKSVKIILVTVFQEIYFKLYHFIELVTVITTYRSYRVLYRVRQ